MSPLAFFEDTMEAQLNMMRGRIVVRLSRMSFGNMAKRMLDIVAAIIGLILLIPVFVIVGILIKRDSVGPVFYRGPRIGKNGRPFQILKFRTMHETAASYDGPRLTSSGDQRITPLGRWLRNTKINELPQLWNLLLGDMSLVGPRPEDPEIFETYPEKLGDEVLSIRPGITSPASVLYHSEEDMLSSTDLMGTYLRKILPDKLRLDQLYVHNRSFFSDIDIVFWTLAIFFPMLAKMKIPEGYLFAGPLSRFVYRHFSWFLADMAVVFAAVSVVAVAWRTQEPLNWGWDSCFVLSLGFALVFSAVNYATGLNRILWSKATGDDVFGILFSAGVVTCAALFANYLQDTYHWLPFPALPTVLILSIGLLAHFGFVSVRYRFRLLTWLAESWSAMKKNAPGTGERILILGEGETCHIATWLLRRGIFRHAFSIVGIVTNEDPTKQGMKLNGCRVVGGIHDLPALIKKHDVRIIVYALSSVAASVQDMVFATSETSGIKLVFLDDLVRFISRKTDKPADVREYLDWLQRRTHSSHSLDALTGLPNSTLLEERIRHSLAYSKRYHTTPALLFIDLNGSVNPDGIDGPRVEEEILKMAAARLMRFKRESDTLARLRKHEFALLLENVPSESAAETILSRAKALMAEPIEIGDSALSMDPKIGLCFPLDNLEDLQKRLCVDLDDKSFAQPLASKAIGPMKAMGPMAVAPLARGTPNLPNRRSEDRK
jgi:diguanylate cyclase (GGDEF)-like protein